jgi:hypothetical protein
MKLPNNTLKKAVEKAQLILVEGENGSGKTVYSINRAFADYGKYPLIVSLDKKADRTKAAAIDINSFAEFNEIIAELMKPETQKEYSSVVFDVLSELDDVVHTEAIRRWNVNEGGQINTSKTQIEQLDFSFNYGSQKKVWIGVWEQIIEKIKMLSRKYQVIVTDYTVVLDVLVENLKNEKGEIIDIKKTDIKGPVIATYLKQKKPFVMQSLKALADEHIRCQTRPGLIDENELEFVQIKVMARDENAAIDWDTEKAADPIIITEEKKVKKTKEKEANTVAKTEFDF